jgi:hypothetical protein
MVKHDSFFARPVRMNLFSQLHYALILWLLFSPTWAAEKTSIAAVIEGEPQPITLLNAGAGVGKIMAVGSNEAYQHWLTVCLDVPGGEKLKSACANDLRALDPPPSVLVSGFRVARADLPHSDNPWLVSIGQRIPAVVARTVLQTVRKLHAGPLVVRGWNESEEKLISITFLPNTSEPVMDAGTLDRLCAPSDDKQFRALLTTRPSDKVVLPLPEITDLRAAQIIDLNLCSADGQQPTETTALQTTGGTWTAAGLFFPGHHVIRFPAKFPTTQIEAPAPTAAYRAAIRLPDDNTRSITVTLVLFQISNAPGQDNLFNLGQRSRWFSAQTNKKGELLIGLENRWAIFPAETKEFKPMTLALGQWHTLSVGVNNNGQLLRAMLNGQASNNIYHPDLRADVRPRRIDETGQNILSFVDPGTARHFHGFIQRVIVHAGLVSVEALSELHRLLPTHQLALPAQELLDQALTGDANAHLNSDEPQRPKPENVNDF